MYEAYSFGKGKTIKIEDATDLNEIFGCPNPKCSAKFKATVTRKSDVVICQPF